MVTEVRGVVRGPKGDAVLEALERSVALLGRRQPGKAVTEAERAKRLAPRSSSVREILGLAYYGQERYREALSEIQAYRRMSGRADQNHIAGDCYRALGQPEKAVKLAAEELDADVSAESRAEAAVIGASALADTGRTDEALAMLRRFRTRADAARPFDLRVWYVTGDILARVGRTEEAAEEFRRIVRHDADAYDAAERLAQLS